SQPLSHSVEVPPCTTSRTTTSWCSSATGPGPRPWSGPWRSAPLTRRPPGFATRSASRAAPALSASSARPAGAADGTSATHRPPLQLHNQAGPVRHSDSLARPSGLLLRAVARDEGIDGLGELRLAEGGDVVAPLDDDHTQGWHGGLQLVHPLLEW